MSHIPKWIDAFEKPKALMIVAHPDDETIFAGGLIQKPDVEWTMLCCIHEHDDQREIEFHNATDFLSKCSNNTIHSKYLGITPNNIHEIEERIRSFTTDCDIVFTHNQMGEYGNEHHKAVYRAVIRESRNPNIWLFISPGSTNVNQIPLKSKQQDGNESLSLSREILKNKIRTFQEFYPSQSKLYGYDKYGSLRCSDLMETLEWEFESGREEFTFYK